jgi:hypothetical protein
MLDERIIVCLRYSYWVANLVPVRKKSGEIRLCVDFWNKNKCSLKDNYPLPKMDHILQGVLGAHKISLLDGCFGYNQIEICEGDKEKKQHSPPLGGNLCTKKCPFG